MRRENRPDPGPVPYGFEIDDEGARMFNLSCLLKPGQGRRAVRPGTYTRLVMDDSWDHVMSDTHAERMDHLWAVRRAARRVLVTGLGLGLVANAMLLREEVESVTVVEIDRDIIMLVAGHWLERFAGRLQVVHADAFSWAPPAPRGRGMFEFAWHDIWPSICSDNWGEMKRLKRHFQKWAASQECWCEDDVRHLNRIGY